MKVLLLNGSPHEKGNTYTALDAASALLREQGVGTELFWLGTEPVSGCTGCGACGKLGRCVIDDKVNLFCDKLADCDGLIVGTPAHYASPAGALIAFLDRAFYARSRDFAHKPAAAVAIARRAGTTASLDVINKYFTISQMPVVSSSYWNVAFGRAPGETKLDAEGMQTVRNMARNMAWLLRCIEAGKSAGIDAPPTERGSVTNFIR